jgi:hypothetical protein
MRLKFIKSVFSAAIILNACGTDSETNVTANKINQLRDSLFYQITDCVSSSGKVKIVMYKSTVEPSLQDSLPVLTKKLVFETDAAIRINELIKHFPAI